MKVQVAVYSARCGASGRGCEIEEFVDDSVMPHRITGPGRVLSKCPNHADVPDEALYGVMQAEGRAVFEARRALGEEGNTMRYRLEGTGANRTLKIL